MQKFWLKLHLKRYSPKQAKYVHHSSATLPTCPTNVLLNAIEVNGDRRYGWKSLNEQTYDSAMCDSDPVYNARIPVVLDSAARLALYKLTRRFSRHYQCTMTTNLKQMFLVLDTFLTSNKWELTGPLSHHVIEFLPSIVFVLFLKFRPTLCSGKHQCLEVGCLAVNQKEM